MVVLATILLTELQMGMSVDYDSKKLEPCDPFLEPDATLPTPDSDCCKNLKEEDWLLL